MTPLQLLRILWARRYVVLVIFVLITGAAGAYVMWWPKSYLASTTLLVDFKAPAGLEDQPLQYSTIYMATQMDVLRSRGVALRVVDRLKLTQNPAARSAYFNATGRRDAGMRQWLADSLLRSLEVQPGRNSRVLTVGYVGSDPAFAATMANAFAQAYIEANLSQQVNPARRGAQWFEAQLETLRDRLEQAQAELSAFQREQGLIATDARLDVETARLSDLARELTAAEAERTDAQAQRAALKNMRASGAGLDTLPEAGDNPLVQQLKADLVRAQSEFARARSLYGENHPRYRAAAQEVALLRSRLGGELGSVSRGIEERVARAQDHAERVRRQLEDQRQKVLELTRARDQLPPLERKVAAAQQAYDLALVRHQESTMQSHVSDTNVSVLATATPPRGPQGFNPRLVLAAAAILGLALAVAGALGWELVDPRVRSADELAERLHVPVLGSVAPGPA